MEEKKYIFKKLYKKHFPKNKLKRLQTVRTCLVPGEINPDQHWDIVKLVDFFKEKILGASRLKDKFTYKGKKIRLWSDLTTVLYVRRLRSNSMSKIPEERKGDLRILHSAKLTFRCDGQRQNIISMEEHRDDSLDLSEASSREHTSDNQTSETLT